MKGLDHFTGDTDDHLTEHPTVHEILDDIFNSGWPKDLVFEEVEHDVEADGSYLEKGFTLPNTPYSWRETETVAHKWELMTVEHILCDESHPQHRFQQAASRATEHTTFGSGQTVISGMTRDTFFEPVDVYDDELNITVHISAPSAELIRTILEEVERRLRSRKDVTIEEVRDHHDD